MGRRIVVVLLTVLAAVTVAPGTASADDDDEVRLRVSDGFVAGEPPRSVSLQVRRRDDGCVSVRVRLGFELDGARPEQVLVAVTADGRSRALAVTRVDDDRLVTETVRPERSRLCEKRDSSTTVRFKVAFAAGTPGGEVEVVGEAYTAEGELMDRSDVTREVEPGEAPPPSPTPSPSASPTPDAEVPSAAPEPTEAVGTIPAAAAPPATGDGGGFLNVGTVLMGFGGLLVAAGLALLVVLVRRTRGARDRGPPGGETTPTVLLPRIRP